MESKETPSQWCDRMIRAAKTGDEAMAYCKLKERWESLLKQSER